MPPLGDSGRLKQLADDFQRKSELGESAARARRLRQPTIPTIPGYEFAALTLPCGDISGDFHDFVPLN
jgi:hypothetical protein